MAPNRKFYYITLLRDPVSRYLSEWRHVQRGATWKTSLHMCDGRTPTPEELPSCYEGSDWSGCTLQQFMDCPYNLANNRQVRKRKKRHQKQQREAVKPAFVAGSSHGYGAANWRKCSREGKAQINPQPILLFLWIYLTANILKNCWFQTWYCYWSLLARSPASDCTFGIINTGPLERTRLVVSKGIYLVNGSMLC